VFQRRTTTGAWAQVQKVAPAELLEFSYFGSAVSISGSTFAASARDSDLGPKDGAGAVYIYVKSGNEWTLGQTLTATEPQDSGRYGQSVSLDGNTLAVSAWETIGTQEQDGSVYVYTRTGTGAPFTLQQRVFGTTTGSGTNGERFGISVAAQGDVLAVGAPTSGNPDETGAAYVFVRSAQEVWGAPVRLAHGDLAGGDYFGCAVALDGDTLVVGAMQQASRLGAAYVYVNASGTWTFQQKLTASDGAADDFFSSAVASEGDRIVVGAYGVQGKVGRAYAFKRSGTTWTETAKYDPKKHDASADDQVAGQFGADGIALQGTTLMVGAAFATADTAPPTESRGAVYVIPVAA
jgi:hypothetical protein